MNETQMIHTGSQATIILGEKLVASDVQDLKIEMKSLIAKGVKSISLDCTQLILLDSTGIGCLIAAHNSLIKLSGSLLINQVSNDIYDLLCSMRLDRHINIVRLASA